MITDRWYLADAFIICCTRRVPSVWEDGVFRVSAAAAAEQYHDGLRLPIILFTVYMSKYPLQMYSTFSVRETVYPENNRITNNSQLLYI